MFAIEHRCSSSRFGQICTRARNTGLGSQPARARIQQPLQQHQKSRRVEEQKSSRAEEQQSSGGGADTTPQKRQT
jgi:hypothetical protein